MDVHVGIASLLHQYHTMLVNLVTEGYQRLQLQTEHRRSSNSESSFKSTCSSSEGL